MVVPYVYIEQEPFVNMVLASIDTFRRECLGLIFGRQPSRRRDYFHVTNMVAIQLAKKRINKEVEWSKMSKKRIREIIDKYPTLFPLLGDVHSHPEWGSYRREPSMSNGDLRDMKIEGFALCIVIKIQLVNKERNKWESSLDGGVRGSLGKYKFHINTSRLDTNDQEEILQIKAPGAIKILNRMIGY